MSQNIMPMAKLLSRKLLPLMKPQGRVRANRQPLRLVHSGRIKKVSPLTTSKSSRCLSPGESQLAEALANIKDNYQRPDKDLIEAMRNKRRFPTPAVDQEEPSAESLQPSSTAAEPDSSAVAEPTSIVKSSQPKTIIALPPEPPKQIEDWEDRAKKIIDQENLSLDRGWSKFTWKQKASNVVRLKLLKDDGYDIIPLQVKGTSADQIIDALLAHVDARTQTAPIQNLSTALDTNAHSEPMKYLEEDGVTDTEDEERFPLASDKTMNIGTFPHRSDVTNDRNIRPGPRVSPEDKLYPTVPVIGEKRKHDHHDDDQPEWHERLTQPHLHTMYNEIRPQRDSLSADEPKGVSCTCGTSSPKRLCLVTPGKINATITGQAHELMNKRISRKIFRSSRAASKVFRACLLADESSSALKAIFTPEKPPKSARIVFTLASTPATQPSSGDIYMGSVGSDLIVEEAKSLSSYLDEDGRYYIYDPESGEDMDGNLLMERSGLVYGAFRHDIRLTSGKNQAAIIEGNPRALISLVEHLRKEDLHHLCRYRPIDIDEDTQGVRDVEMKLYFLARNAPTLPADDNLQSKTGECSQSFPFENNSANQYHSRNQFARASLQATLNSSKMPSRKFAANEKNRGAKKFDDEDFPRYWVSEDPFSLRNENARVEHNQSDNEFNISAEEDPHFGLVHDKYALIKAFLEKEKDLSLFPHQPKLRKEGMAVAFVEPPITITSQAQNFARLHLDTDGELRRLNDEAPEEELGALLEQPMRDYLLFWDDMKASLVWQMQGQNKGEKNGKVENVMDEVFEKLVVI
ncbi:hypothetical protein DDE83_002623 [Stemphylium lycopersici]|uniref:Uncharacterized protein n=1 Tax=Stemphylium lycopersici TaxID=183478 RepID=A0A364N9N2_STELY|nr:hypothetical protein DDE83_002623 [Stemphylium lycopersici]